MRHTGAVSDDPGLRASDADREAVVRRLQDAHAEGRITLEELSERLDRAAAARTMGDLEQLTRDIPRAAGPVAAAPASAAQPSHTEPAAATGVDRTTRQVWIAYLSACVVTTLIWLVISLASGHLTYFWPVWVIGFGLIGPVSRLFSGQRR